MTRRAFFPGSFDPFTNGHLDILLQAFGIADEVVIGVGMHASKKGMFTFEERKSLIEEIVPSSLKEKLEIQVFDDLVVDAAKRANTTIMVRGLRDGTDFDYEMQLAGMNSALCEAVQTIFFPSSTDTRPISATLVRQVAQLGGDVSPFVPEVVAKALKNKLSNK